MTALPLPALGRRRFTRYAPAINSLGERICLGCGVHFVSIRTGSYGVSDVACCSGKCRKRVHDRGGRRTVESVRDQIATMRVMDRWRGKST